MSTLSVNNITTQTGDTITVPSGKVLASPGLPIQTVLGQDETGTSMGNAGVAVRFMNVPITTKVANSTFLIRFSSAVYSAVNAGQYDVDLAAAMGFKTGTASTVATDYIAISTYSPTRETITFADSADRAFFAMDAFPVNASYNKYIPVCSLYNEDTFSPNQPAGTVINVACFIKVDGNPAGGAYINIGASISGMADSGMVSTLTVTEFAP